MLIYNGASSLSRQQRALGRRLRREVEPGAVRAILDLNDPKVGVKRNFPFESPLRFVRVKRRPRMCDGEDPINTARGVRSEGLRRRSIERGAPVQMIDLNENRASLRSAAAAKDRAYPFHSASTQIGGDPNVGAQAQRI
jgi:hypothetical protein